MSDLNALIRDLESAALDAQCVARLAADSGDRMLSGTADRIGLEAHGFALNSIEELTRRISDLVGALITGGVLSVTPDDTPEILHPA